MHRNAPLGLLGLVFLVLTCCPAWGQQWAEDMFETTEHDFGSIARGGEAVYEYVLSNPYLEDVHIAGVRSSCGCTSVQIKQADLKTYETSAIIARINSRTFLGDKGATLTVTIDRPFYAQVQLKTKVYIRSDVVLHPGSVDLGSVQQGSSVEKKISITYAGRSDWQIVEVRSANPHIEAQVVETRRSAGQVAYDLIVRLDERAPPGRLNDHLMLITNDYNKKQVPVAVTGAVETGVTVSPSTLFLGVVESGQRVTKQLVVRSDQPFRILSIECDDSDLFEFVPVGQGEAATLHVIAVTFMAGPEAGKVLSTIRIETDLGIQVPELSAYAVISE